jgi:hypothetical protein
MGLRPPSAGSGQLSTYRGQVAASTTYNVNDVVSYRGRRVLITQQVTSGAGAAPFIGAANYIALTGETTVSAYDFGYRADGNQATAAANDAALSAACAYCAAIGGGTVELPAGTGYISAPVELGLYVWLRGQGIFATYLRVADNVNPTSMVRNHVSTGSGDPNASYCGVFELTLDGNLATNATGGHGISFATNPATTLQGGTGLEQFDMHHVIQNVRVRKCHGDGVHLVGRSAIQLENVHCQYNDGYGFFSTFDTNFTHCEADQNGKAGFYINNGSVRLGVCKSYLNGQVDGVGAGFEFGSNAAGATTAACEAQNNKGQGFFLNGANRCNIHGIADSNSYDAVNYAGVELAAGASYNRVSVVCWQGLQGAQVGHQSYALRMTGAGTGNDITLTHSNAPGAVIGAKTTPDTTLTGANRVIINGQSLAGGSGFAAGLKGDGSDSAITLDGTAAPSGFTKAGSVYTINRDVHTTSLTVNSGVTLNAGGWRIFCQGTVTNNGTIQANGNDAGAAGAAGAATTPAGALAAGSAGGAGQTGAGSAGSAGGLAVGNGGAGGAGGTGASGAGGTSGFPSVSGQPTTVASMLRTPQHILTGVFNYFGVKAIAGGSGGGGGGGDGTNKGGGGGSGGGVLAVLADSFVNTGALSAHGGAGGAGVAGNAGGGGGGGGGLIAVYTTSAWTNSGTTDVSGGAGGTPAGTGAAGAAGINGTVFNEIVQ